MVRRVEPSDGDSASRVRRESALGAPQIQRGYVRRLYRPLRLAMVGTIGLMIGAYILTRMLELDLRKETHVAVKIFAALTFLLALVGMFDLVSSGSKAASSLP